MMLSNLEDIHISVKINYYNSQSMDIKMTVDTFWDFESTILLKKITR